MLHRRRGARNGWVLVGVGAVVALVAVVGVLWGSPPGAGRATVAAGGVTGVPFSSPAGSAGAAGAVRTGAAASPSSTATASGRPAASAVPGKAASPQGMLTAGAGQRVVTFVNSTSQTVWAAAQADPRHPLARTGWVVPVGGSVSFLMPNHWNGRLWGRTGCRFDTTGAGHCVTGDCAGRFQCGTAGSRSPETLAEFDLDAWSGMDFYDVNLDGFNLPMWINHSGGSTADKVSANGCIPAGCTHDLLSTCPSVLQDRVGGALVGCQGPCTVLNTDQYCCRKAWSSRATCLPAQWPVDYAAVFKRAEPTGYSYVYDDQSSVYTCSGGCGYRITFGTSR
jgi:hypothetical protein